MPDQPRKRRIAPAALALLVVVVAIAAGVIALRANRLPALTREVFDSAQSQWEEKRPDSYELTVRVAGMQPGTYKVVVQNRTAVSASFDGRPLTRPRTFGTWAVSGMLETLQADLETNARENYLLLSAEFDPVYGFPVKYQRIEMRTGAHDTLQWEVTRFIAN